MAFYFQKTYRPEIEQLLRQYYQSLSEKDRRRFAALEAIKLGHGGIRYIAKVLGCDPQTVKDGMQEIKQLPDDPAGSRIRKPGGGRKKTEVKQGQTRGLDLTGPRHDQRPYRWRPYAPGHGVDGFDPPQRFPTACRTTPSGPDPASCDVFSIGSVWPGARSSRWCPVVTRRIAASSSAIWRISSKRFSKRVTRS